MVKFADEKIYNKELLCILLSVQTVKAQDPGSSAAYGGYSPALNVEGIHASPEEILYIGSGTDEINGLWEHFSKYLVIDPAAVISGTSSIVLF